MSALPTPFTAATHRIRVFIVDDSVVVRRLLTRTLEADPDFEVLGTASSAESAIARLPLLQPDVITLDINMPGMSGLELLPILRKQYPRLRVLLFSSDSAGAAAATVDALLQGATSFLLKPSIDSSLEHALTHLKIDLTLNLKQLCGRRALPAPQARRPQLVRANSKRNREVLAIGVSTGGPTALARLIEGLPGNFPLPIVIVQHMPPIFTRLLADRIRATSGFNIVEAEEGMALEAGKAILAPGDFHMRLARSADGTVRVRLDQGPQECSCRPAVDVLFRSVAEIYGGNALAAILTGMGQDGLRGATELTRLGAYLIAQDEATSVVWGMPGAVTNAGIVDEILPLNDIAAALSQQAGAR
jgi:two-component system chemotaxis response regulator CheB